MTKKYLSLVMAIILSAHAYGDESPNASLIDINYKFDQSKLDDSKDSFHFLRSFVGYYYGLMAANSKHLQTSLNLSQNSGWCVGDAHPENFGVLLQENGTTIFTMNDMDDAGPCPVAYDFLRLLVSSRLYNPKIDSAKIIESYKMGLSLTSFNPPAEILSMLNEGTIIGETPKPKDLDGNLLVRKKDSDEVSSDIRKVIIEHLDQLFNSFELSSQNIKVLDLISTSKIGGGSGGLLRYEILCREENGSLVHLELKELTDPGLKVVATEMIPDQIARMQKSLLLSQGAKASHFYKVLDVGGKTMLLRPKFSGNIGISLPVLDDERLINYEAYTLGRIHSQSVDVTSYLKAFNELSVSDWESDTNAFTKQFNKKYNQLKKE